MSIYYWIQLLPEEIYVKAKNNIIKQDGCLCSVRNRTASTFEDAILAAFDWDNSFEGFDYWSDIMNNYKPMFNTLVYNY